MARPSLKIKKLLQRPAREPPILTPNKTQTPILIKNIREVVMFTGKEAYHDHHQTHEQTQTVNRSEKGTKNNK